MTHSLQSPRRTFRGGKEVGSDLTIQNSFMIQKVSGIADTQLSKNYQFPHTEQEEGRFLSEFPFRM